MSAPLEASFLPPGLGDIDGAWKIHQAGPPGAEVQARVFHPSPKGMEALAEALRERRRDARWITVEERISAFDALAARWLDPTYKVRQALLAPIAAWTGFSRPMVAHALDLEQRSSRAPHLSRALRQELGDPGRLDALGSNPYLGGRSRAVGPGLVGAVTSANIPGLPHLEVLRALLVKGACLAKVPGGEPLFLAAYARSLAVAHPLLGSTVAVVGVNRGDEDARRAFAGAVDHLVVYGGPAAVDAWEAAASTSRATTRRPHGSSWHGHKLGVSVVLREALVEDDLLELTSRLAYDFTLYDREACLAPAAIYVERGGPTPVEGVADAIAAAMARWAEALPPGRPTVARATAQRAFIDAQVIRGGQIVAAPDGLPWLVTLDPVPEFGPSAPGRVVRVVGVDHAEEVPGLLAPLGAYLQCAALAGPAHRADPIAEALAEVGVSRLTRPGLMGLPSMMWRHDGKPCLGAMVRFCDEETEAPEVNVDVEISHAGRGRPRSPE